MNRSILVAESDNLTQSLLQSSLGSAGFQVLPVTDGNAAWMLIQTQNPIAVVVDAILPGLNSREIVDRMQKQNATAQIPIIILGDEITSEERVRWLRLGADNYISKPFSAQVVTAHLRSLIRRIYGTC